MTKNLIIQTQRLGDLVMTFPLCQWLNHMDDRSIWLVGEEKFYKELLRVSPQKVFYLPPGMEAEQELVKEEFHHIINLSHRPEAATLAGKFSAVKHIGSVEQHGIQKVHGNWQLYRTSLTHNNHYNFFHWADMNALDNIPLDILKEHRWSPPHPLNKGRIGLFVGASEEAKRPDANFWAQLAISLAKKGYQPVFLGGPGQEEQNIAKEASALASMPRGNLAGRFSVYELIAFLQTLDLFIVPDTGPMHLAAMHGVAVFNLSLGPVHPWETGPYPPQHYVLRSAVSCSGCWQCTQKKQICREAFIPTRIASLIDSLLQKKKLPTLPGLTLYQTARTAEGLYELTPMTGHKVHTYQQSNFWRYFFANHFFQQEQNFALAEKQNETMTTLFHAQPKLAPLFKKTHLALMKEILLIKKTGRALAHDAWKTHPPLTRPLTSFYQLSLENDNYSQTAQNNAVQLLENFARILT